MDRRFATIALMLGLAGCGQMAGLMPDQIISDYPGATRVAYLDRSYPVRRIADEPTPDLGSSDIIVLPDGGRAVSPDAAMVGVGPAIRVGNASSRQTATDVLATYCRGRGLAIAPGWRDVVVRFDDATAEHIFYMDC